MASKPQPKIPKQVRKNGKRAKSKNRKAYDSIANSRLFSVEEELGLIGLFEGEVYHLSFDCPKPLAKAFKQATHDNGTSICKELQKHALTYVAVDHIEKSAFGNTLSKILNRKIAIENLNFEQYCQTKPRRWIRKGPAEVKGVDNVGRKFVFCEIGTCSRPAVSVMFYVIDGKEYRVCSIHQRALSECGKGVWAIRQDKDYSKGEK